MNTITQEKLAKILDKNNFQGRKSIHLVDVSPREVFAKEHIEGAFNVPLSEIESKQESALPQDRQVVCYGPSLEEAKKAADLYQKLGYQSVAFEGGIKSWKEADLPVVG